MNNSNYVYYYPAVFKEVEDGYTVSFIDFDIVVSGSDLPKAMEIAQKALETYIFRFKKITTLTDLPEPTQSFKNYTLDYDEVILFSSIDLKKLCHKSIHKNLTIPCWLNTLAKENNLNFSQILQEALKKKLGIN